MRRVEQSMNRPLRRARDDRPSWTAAQIKAPPVRYQGDAYFQYSSAKPAEVSRMCRTEGAVGCAVGGLIIGPNPCSSEFAGEKLARLLCHEGAHVLGWRADHPD